MNAIALFIRFSEESESENATEKEHRPSIHVPTIPRIWCSREREWIRVIRALRECTRSTRNTNNG